MDKTNELCIKFKEKINNLNKLTEKMKESKMEEKIEQIPEKVKELETIVGAIVPEVKILVDNVKSFMEKFDKNKDGKLSFEEWKAAMKNPIGKRYTLVFVVVVINIIVAIVQYYWSGIEIGVSTLITLAFSCATVLFGGWIENVNYTQIQVQKLENDQLKIDLNNAFKNSIEKDSTIQIQKNEIESYKKILDNNSITK